MTFDLNAGKDIMDTLSTDDFVKCVHSVGQPLTHGQSKLPQTNIKTINYNYILLSQYNRIL